MPVWVMFSILFEIFLPPSAYVNDRINGFLEGTGLFSDLQYGFKAFRSTTDLLTVLSERLYNSSDVGCEIRAIAPDILKDFDEAWHAGLLHKLLGALFFPSLNLFVKIGLLRLFLMVSPLHHMTSMQEYCWDRVWDPPWVWCISMTSLIGIYGDDIKCIFQHTKIGLLYAWDDSRAGGGLTLYCWVGWKVDGIIQCYRDQIAVF